MVIDHSQFKDKKIATAQDAVDVLKSIRLNMDPLEIDKEYLYVISLKRNNKIKFIDIVSIGSLTGTVAEPREIFRRAIIHAANSVLIIHNHPSGSISPSTQDVKLTNKIKSCAGILGIELTDSIIFSEEGFYSFANEGFL